jgi:hypothetical protein
MPASDVEVTAGFLRLVRYVREGGTGYGTSWEDASGDLQEMMDEHWLQYTDYQNYTYIVKVGAGTYKPQHLPVIPASPGSYTAGGRDSTFILRPGVQVWGGYPAGGGDSRNVTANETVLSGDLDGDSSFSSDDAYHVVLTVDIPFNSGTVLDGLSIKGGNANGGGSFNVGGKDIERSKGGGMYNVSSSPVLTNVTISGNTATNDGGGVYVAGGTFNMTGGTIGGTGLGEGNTASGNGGGVCFAGATFDMTGGTISGNKASSGGGVCFAGTTFNMSGGAIAYNEVAVYPACGGGVYVSGGIFTMSGNAAISNNNSDYNGRGGGGVFLSAGNFIMNDGTISGNYGYRGGGVRVEGGTFTMSGNAAISGNNGDFGGGGGVYLDGGGSIAKTGGIIYGDKKEDTTSEDSSLQNNASEGYAVGGAKKRDTTAGPTVTLDSGTGINWE